MKRKSHSGRKIPLEPCKIRGTYKSDLKDIANIGMKGMVAISMLGLTSGIARRVFSNSN